MLRRPEALNTAKAEPTGDIYSRETRQRIGEWTVGLWGLHRICVSGLSPPHCPCIACVLIIQKVLGFVNERGKLFFYCIFHLATDCGRSTVCGRVEALSFGMLVFGDFNDVILLSTQEDQGHASQWSKLFRF